jgi:two-component system sensor histidine kinase ChiS
VAAEIPSTMKYTPLRYHIMAYVLMLVVPLLVLLSVVNYMDTRKALIASNQILQAQTENNIANALRFVDTAYKTFERPLDERLQQAFQPFLAAYANAGGDLEQIDLNRLKEELEAFFKVNKGNLDLYIINEAGVIVSTTYETDLGLDFQAGFPSYYQRLNTIRQNGKFEADRITAEARTGELRKYAYQPTPDLRYVLELGVTIKEFPEFLEEMNPVKIAERLQEFNPTLEQIRLFNRSGLYVLGQPDQKLDDATHQIIVEMEKRGESRRDIPEPRKQRLLRYILVSNADNGEAASAAIKSTLHPFIIASNVVELTYSTRLMDAALRQQIIASLGIGVLAVILTAAIAFWVAARVVHPIRGVTDAANRLAEGQWQYHLPTERNDELGELSRAFAQMANQLQDSFRELESKNQELSRLDQLKDEFLTNTSHELRTPLNGIIGIAESLLDGATGALPEATRYNLVMLVSSGRRLANLINDILDFSRLRHKDLNLHIKPVDIHSVAEIVCSLLKPLIAQKKDLQLRNLIPRDAPAVAADENRLQQILYNLLGNAIKFTDRGYIEVSASVQYPTLRPEYTAAPSAGKHLVIRVEDTGIGIAADKMPHIFESFEQADGSIARQYGGTGLGLAVTRQLVELHGGQIVVESTPGQGSVFTFSLPLAEGQPETSAAPLLAQTPLSQEFIVASMPAPDSGDHVLRAAQAGSGFKVLVVDDEPINHQVLINNLFIHNYTIIQANSGMEALEMLDNGLQPDLILLDIMMPRMTGYEVTRKIRETRPANELPILLLTAKNQVRDLVTGLELGANDYITKPISKDELLARIKTHLNLKQLDDDNRRLTLVAEQARLAAESASRAKSAFLANISHELRTPLNAIIGYSSLLYEEALDMGCEKAAMDDLEKIQTAGKGLLGIISDVLDLTKIEADKIDLRLEEFDLNAMVRDTVTVMRPQLGDDNHLLLHCPAELGSMRADRYRTQQILQNLLGNAGKFTRRGNIGLTVEAGGDLAIFRVSDTGIGIPAEYLEKIFEPFCQVDSSSTRLYGGTGLGLALSRQMCRAMGGDITVASELGKGSVFTVRIPRQASPEAASA